MKNSFQGFYADEVDHILSRSQKKPPKSTKKGLFLELIAVKRTKKGGEGVECGMRKAEWGIIRFWISDFGFRIAQIAS
jgi:hypothetical protein